MGSSFTKDDNIDIFIQTRKPYYVAGEYVDGCVYLNVKQNSNYSNLTLYVLGKEHVYWSEGSGKNRRSYRNDYESYKSFFLMQDFRGNLPKGSYSQPFAFLLPNMMCGSFYDSSNCYIQYTIKAELIHPTEQKMTQPFQIPLNIIQPPRMQIGQVATSQITNAKCCGCCADYGTTSISMTCDKNFVLSGDTIRVNGRLDHSQGKEDIKTCRVMLQQMRIMISSGGRTRNANQQEWAMYGINEPVRQGTTKDFEFTATIPNLDTYTAIGRVTARYFLLHFITEYGCCANTANAVIHLVVHSRNPRIVPTNKLAPTPNWSPQTFPQIVCEQMKPYLHNPLPQIPYHNMPGQTMVIPAMGNGTMGTMQPYEEQGSGDVQNYGYGQGQGYGQGGQGYGQGYVAPDVALYNHYQPQFFTDIDTSAYNKGEGGHAQPYFQTSLNNDIIAKKI